MITGIGTDILYMKHLSKDSLKEGDAFLSHIYSSREIEEAKNRELPFYFYAVRFAGKEAVFKCLNPPLAHVKFSEIEILDDETGAPHVTLYGELGQWAEKQKIDCVHISLSYEEEYAVAYAVAERNIYGVN